MLLKNRVIWSDNGTLKDISDLMNNSVSGSKVIDFVAAQDYIYLGAEAPFNHRWVEVKVANTAASAMSVHLWDGDSWEPVAEAIDQTLDLATLGKTMSLSGRIAWVPDKFKKQWGADDTYSTSGNITGLSTLKIFNLYWARLSFSGNWSASTELSYIGWKFANDEDLYALYPEFSTSEALTRFKSGSTTFDQVHFEAAKQVIRDLKGDQVLDSGNQVLEWEVLRLPAIHKAAELIYNAYGSDWEDERKLASAQYKKAMAVELFDVDSNSDASLDPRETHMRTGTLIR